MGKFIYDSSIRVEFEDRLLAHLQIVIAAKVRRGESFHFTWRDPAGTGNGRTMVWIHPAVSLAYLFYGSRQPTVNRAWIDALMYTANSNTALYPVAEPAEGTPGKPLPAIRASIMRVW